MGGIWTGPFWRATAERVIATAAQAALGVLGAGAVGVLDVDWASLGSVVGLAALAALLKCVAAGAANPETGPAATNAESELTTARLAEAPAAEYEGKHRSA